MQNYRTPLLLILACSLVLLLVSGCFQTAGESMNGVEIAQDFVTLTPMTETEPEIQIEEPTEEPGIEPEIPLDIQPELPPEPTEEVAPEFEFEQPVETEIPFEFATETPFVYPTSTPMNATPFPDDQALSVPGQEQPPDVIDEAAQTATAIIEAATQQVEAALTATAMAEFDFAEPTQDPGQGGGFDFGPTPTPFFEPTPIPPFQPTQPPQFPPGYVPGQDCIHEVQYRDNLFRLSLYYGLPIDQIAQRNGITNINLIIVGQKLVIPGCGTTGNPPPPTSVPGTGPYPPYPQPPSGRIHVVRQYENLFRLSLQYGVSVHAIAAANGIANINLIYIGQQLVIP